MKDRAKKDMSIPNKFKEKVEVTSEVLKCKIFLLT